MGLSGLVLLYDFQHAAGSGVPEGPTGGVRRAACTFGGPGDVCTNHRDRCVCVERDMGSDKAVM